MDDIYIELLDKPVGPEFESRTPMRKDLTREIEYSGDEVVAVINAEPGLVNEGTGLQFLEDEGLNPKDWEATGFTKSQWGEGKESVKFTYKRSQSDRIAPLTEEQIAEVVRAHEPPSDRPSGDFGYLVLIGDMQFGKSDGDGWQGTLRRTLACIDKAVEQYGEYSALYKFGHVHIAWLGDHIEGFNSQGGANAWRTNLTLTEQIRLTRRVMLYALEKFAPLAERVTFAAVPGNHGETVRFAGKGITRYDDSHDTEALVSVMDAAKYAPDLFGHVEFYVPDTDELIVLVEVAGTLIAHHHGHSWRPNKHFEWWQGQAFNRESAMHVADLLVAGHLHHEHIEADGSRTFIGVPSMESDSTWFRHNTGTGGAPGLIVAITKDGQTPVKHVISAS